MVNWKSKYLKYKLKFKKLQKGGVMPAMQILIDDLAQTIRNTPMASIPEMNQLLQMMNVNLTTKNYILANHADSYCLILLKYIKEEITNNHVLDIPVAFDDGNGNLNYNAIIPHLMNLAGPTWITTQHILDDILESLLDSNILTNQSKINLAAQIANLIGAGAVINPLLITSDYNINNYNIVRARGFIYAQLQYIHNIPIYPYFNIEPLGNMPTIPWMDANGNLIHNLVSQPDRTYYAGHANPNQAYADATLQYYMQIHRWQLNIRQSILLPPGGGAPIAGDPGYPNSLPVLRGMIRNLANNNNYINAFSP